MAYLTTGAICLSTFPYQEKINGIFENEKENMLSPVIVGKNVTKTVIFSGKLSFIVFSPYWYLPVSIINKEVKPGMAKNKNYLETHNLEWNNGQVRQKPGKIDAAMPAGNESTYPLKSKIPVYIGYFTIWVDEQGVINFYDDIYGLDGRLAELLIDEK